MTWVAVTTGLWQSAPVLMTTSFGVWYLSRNSPTFAKSLGPSGKTALILMPWMAAWSFLSETGVGKALDENISQQDKTLAGEFGEEELPFKLRSINYFYDNTLLAFLGLVTPMYGGILAHELSKPRHEGWQLSHAIIHTRVLGQAAAIGSLIVVFGGREWLKANGAPYGRTSPLNP